MQLSLLTDTQLLNDYVQMGNANALGELYKRYMHLVYGVCLKYFKQRDTSKEMVVRIFEKLIDDLHKQEIANFKSWLYVVTKNFCLMELRRQKAGLRREQLYLENASLFMESEDDVHPLDNGEGLTEALEKCIDKLKNDQKQCIELFYFNNKSYIEIGNTLNIDPKKVKSYIQNGKRNLKICLDNQHEAQATI